MNLHSLDFLNENSKDSILILHGLFASSKNWQKIATYLQKDFNVYCIDARNHGDSPHVSSHTLEDLSNDLEEFIEQKKIQKPILLGHSMGGLACMHFSLNYPEVSDNLIIVDIAPKSYLYKYEEVIASLELDFSNIATRKQIDEAMSKFIKDPYIRSFLQMSLYRDSNGKFACKINTEALKKKYLDFNIKEKTYGKSIHFIIGEKTTYFLESDKQKVYNYFPNAKLNYIKNGEHYIHHTHSEQFLALLDEILK